MNIVENGKCNRIMVMMKTCHQDNSNDYMMTMTMMMMMTMMKTFHQGSTSHQNHLFGHLSIDLLAGVMSMVTMVMIVIILIVTMVLMVMMVMVMMIMFILTNKRSFILVVIDDDGDDGDNSDNGDDSDGVDDDYVYSNLQKIFHPCSNRQSSIKCGVSSQRNVCHFFGS